MNMPQTGFSRRDMLIPLVQRLGEFLALSKSVEEAHRAGQNKNTNRDVSVLVVMVGAFLRALLARHSKNGRGNEA